MKRILLSFLLLLVPLPLRAEEAVVAARYPLERYEVIWKKSPFTLSSVGGELTGNFADDLVLAGVLKIGNRNYVSVFNKKTKQRHLLAKDSEAGGMSLVKLDLRPDLKDVAVTLKKGNEIAMIRYDQQLIKDTLVGASSLPVALPAVASPPVLPNRPPEPANRPPVVIIPSQPPNL